MAKAPSWAGNGGLGPIKPPEPCSGQQQSWTAPRRAPWRTPRLCRGPRRSSSSGWRRRRRVRCGQGDGSLTGRESPQLPCLRGKAGVLAGLRSQWAWQMMDLGLRLEPLKLRVGGEKGSGLGSPDPACPLGSGQTAGHRLGMSGMYSPETPPSCWLPAGRLGLEHLPR